MKKQRIYMDTSVFGKHSDLEFNAVQFMREQRKLLSEKLSKMTKAEIVEYFKKKRLKGGVKPGA